jgi:N-acetylneuraminate synthase
MSVPLLPAMPPPAVPVQLVAEISGNHSGCFDTACALVDAAARAGFDAVKLQTYTPAAMVWDAGQQHIAEAHSPWAGQCLQTLYQQAHTPWAWHAPLFARGRQWGLSMFTSVFDVAGLAQLEALPESLRPLQYKIASFELVDLPLLAAVAATGKPLILSTGMASDDEVAQALATVTQATSGRLSAVTLLHCTSAYPAPAEAAALQNLPRLAQRFLLPTGLSDHSVGSAIAVAAVTLGAVMIEKHVALDSQAVDASFSLVGETKMRSWVHDVRQAEAALRPLALDPATGCWQRPEAELVNRAYRRSWFVVQPVRQGQQLMPAHLRTLRPALGLPPATAVVGRVARCDIAPGTPLTEALLVDSSAGG